jgi:hypothetical protein
VRYIIILFGLALLWLSTSRKMMGYLAKARTSDTWWGAYDWHKGNLVGLSHLDFVTKFISKEEYTGKRAVYNVPGKTVLFLHGDSNTGHAHLKDTDFAGVCALHFLYRDYTHRCRLDTSARNVLIIEIAEHDMRKYFSTTGMRNEVYGSAAGGKNMPVASVPTRQQGIYSLLLPVLPKSLFNRNINQNLEFNLFNYNFIMPVFSIKAGINFYLFNRASGDVVISNDRSYLFSRETVTLTDITSSYVPVSNDELSSLINNLNSIYDHLKQEGFHEIYLSIIPNCATVVQPEGYNQLIPLIQNDAGLKMKIIDIYSVLKHSPRQYYLSGDTHWTDKGFTQWLKVVNDSLVHKS